MTIQSFKQAVCNNCGNGIDHYPYSITTKRLNEIVEEHGGLVFGRKHFCDAGCYADFCKDANCTKDDGGLK
jgi:hypothetical protein